ncbi:LacI family transcriptional regulator [Pararhizobium sp. YC-54]|uniref:LacI family DNA-binding transcriptional regulator n=1 Tax=Pararhizobium sp. YC-54 TaxID=2986920 RepID=UPI0021F7790E|nr:LacI family DNA-binding transcriptional regulator [Pararhizobium sp. YC-54]MCW0001041.1 LacI family transcriptional regulator [Pararhizobium sp. YC-54]
MADKRADKVTITEVAKLAGVSTATAGRVLGGYGYTSEENKEKVRRSAEALGYRPNLLARSLITGKTKTIGVVAGDIQSPFYASILRGIADVARAQGFGVLLTNSDELLDREIEAVQLLLEKQIDGLIVAPCDTSGSQHLHAAAASGCPIVQIDRRVNGLSADSVTLDNCGAASDSITQLLAAGHRRIGMVAELERWEFGDMETFIDRVIEGSIDPASLFPSWQRLFGYIEAHRAAGLLIDRNLIGRVGTYSVKAARTATMELLSRPNRPTALFTADGLMSAVAMDAITSLDLQIPTDLSLICFDDLDWMSFLKPGITAIAQPLTEMGEASARLILARIGGEGGEEQHQVLKHTLALRGSVMAPQAGRA